MTSVQKKQNVFTISLENVSKQADTKKNEKWWHIDRQMIRYKVHYFLLIGGLGAMGPFVPVFAKTNLGLSAGVFGTIVTVMQLSNLIAKPLFGFVVDYFNKLKAALYILGVAQALIYFAYFTLPAIPLNTVNHQNATNYDLPIYNVDAYNSCTKFKASQNLKDVPENNSLPQASTGTSLHYNLTFPFSYLISHDIMLPCLECRYLPDLASNNSDNNNLMIWKCKHLQNSMYISEGDDDFQICDSYASMFKTLPSSGMDNQSFYLEASLCTKLRVSFCSVTQDPLLENGNCISTENFDTKLSLNHFKFHCSLCSVCTNLSILINVSSDKCNCKYSSNCNSGSINVPKIDTPKLLFHASILVYFRAYQFWIFASVFIPMHIIGYNLLVLSETACCESMQLYGADYGKQRLWGPIGWGLMSAIGGLLSDYTHGYIAACIIQAILFAAMLLNISQMELVKPDLSKNYFKAVGSIMKSKTFVAFAFVIFINGIGIGIAWYYLVWFIISLGGNNTISGLVHTLQNLVGEVPFMFFSGWIVKKIGYFHVATLSMFAYFSRFLWYSYLKNPWMVLPMEWIHGINYGVCYAAMVTFAKMNAKPGTEATAQAILSAFDSLGSLVGNAMAGVSIDYIGGHQTFFYASFFFCICSVVSFSFTLLCLERK